MKSQAVMTQQSNIATIGPDQYIAAAIEKGASIETLERLMDLKERHDKTEAKKAFISAMQQFQSMKPDLPRNQAVSFGNNKTAYNFCPLPEIEKRLREPLSECGLSYRFENLNKDGGFGVRCVVTHAQGHSEYTEMYAPADTSGNKNQIQSIGSTSTYLMRYTLIASFALTTADEDDDGAAQSDLPLQRVLQHNAVLRDNLEGVVAIKEAIARNDLYDVAMYMDNMPEATKSALWLAPTKGGIFTTKEIAVFKTNEYASARADYFAEKETKGIA